MSDPTGGTDIWLVNQPVTVNSNKMSNSPFDRFAAVIVCPHKTTADSTVEDTSAGKKIS